MSSEPLALLTQLTARKLVPGRYRGLEQRRRLSLTVALRPCAGYVQPSRRVPDNRGNASVLLRTRRRRVRDSRNPSRDRTGRTPPSTCTLHLRTCAGLPNLAVLDQGGACGAAGPSVSAGLCRLGRPARRTSGRTARPPDQRGSHVMQTSARPAVLPRCSLSSPRSLPSPSQDPEASTLAASR
jgi:hypothetical protein